MILKFLVLSPMSRSGVFMLQFVFSVVDRDDEVVLALMQHMHSIKSDQRKFSWRPTMHMLSARYSQSAEHTQLAKHSQSTEHSQLAERSQLSEPSQPAESSKPAELSQLAKTSELAELSHPAKFSESADSSKPAKSNNHVNDKEWTIQTHRDCLTVGFTVLKVGYFLINANVDDFAFI